MVFEIVASIYIKKSVSSFWYCKYCRTVKNMSFNYCKPQAAGRTSTRPGNVDLRCLTARILFTAPANVRTFLRIKRPRCSYMAGADIGCQKFKQASKLKYFCVSKVFSVSSFSVNFSVKTWNVVSCIVAIYYNKRQDATRSRNNEWDTSPIINKYALFYTGLN